MFDGRASSSEPETPSPALTDNHQTQISLESFTAHIFSSGCVLLRIDALRALYRTAHLFDRIRFARQGGQFTDFFPLFRALKTPENSDVSLANLFLRIKRCSEQSTLLPVSNRMPYLCFTTAGTALLPPSPPRYTSD